MSSQIDILFPDLLGLAHGKTVPEARCDHPTHYAITCMVQGLDLGFLETANYSTSAGFPDMEARFEDGTLRPWGARRVALANLHFADGRPLPAAVVPETYADPRTTPLTLDTAASPVTFTIPKP